MGQQASPAGTANTFAVNERVGLLTAITLNDLCDNLWEGLDGQVSVVEVPSEKQLSITLRCEDWQDSNLVREFRINCDQVVESTLQPSPCDELGFVNDHVLLWNFNHAHYSLFYASVPENGHEILGLLWEAHERALNTYSEHLVSISPVNFIEHCGDGYGLLARGPKPLMEIYQKAISDKIKTRMVSSHTPRGGYCGLLFECGYVIAQSFKIDENLEMGR